MGDVITPRDPARTETNDPCDRPGVDPTTDPDRHASVLHRFGHGVNPVERELVISEGGHLVTPERLAHRERVVEQRAATTEVESGRLVLLALPADADAEIESTSRQGVEGRRLI